MRVRRRQRSAAPAPVLTTPPRESFDPAAPSDSFESPTASRRAPWVVAAAIVVLAVVVGALVQRATPPPPPTAPAPGLDGDLLFAVVEPGGRSRLWIWDLATGAIRRGPTVRDPLALVNAYEAEPQGGWIGVVAQDGDGQVAGLLRNFTANDVPAPVLEGDLVSWAPGGDRVVAATKDPAETCSSLQVETLTFAYGSPRLRLDDAICGQLSAVGLDGLYPHVGLRDDDDSWIARVAGGAAIPWLRGAELFAAAPNGGALVTRTCVVSSTSRAGCGGLAYADPSISGSRPIPYGDADVGGLAPERFLGWGLDGRTGYVLATYGSIRGVYAVEAIREGPTPPRLVIPARAGEVHLSESFGVQGGEMFVARDGALIAIRRDGEQVPLPLPTDIPPPDGPIVWVASAGGA